MGSGSKIITVLELRVVNYHTPRAAGPPLCVYRFFRLEQLSLIQTIILNPDNYLKFTQLLKFFVFRLSKIILESQRPTHFQS